MTSRPISQELEEHAREIGNNVKTLEASITSIVEQEIMLTLDHIDRLRQNHKYQINNILDSECRINSEMIQMEDRTPRYSPYKYPERARFIGNLLSIGMEKRRQIASYEDKIQVLEQKLLMLLLKHNQSIIPSKNRFTNMRPER